MHGIGKAPVFRGVELAIERRLNALPAKRHADNVHALGRKVIELHRLRIKIIFSGDAWQRLTVELGTGDVHAGEEGIAGRRRVRGR